MAAIRLSSEPIHSYTWNMCGQEALRSAQLDTAELIGSLSVATQGTADRMQLKFDIALTVKRPVFGVQVIVQSFATAKEERRIINYDWYFWSDYTRNFELRQSRLLSGLGERIRVVKVELKYDFLREDYEPSVYEIRAAQKLVEWEVLQQTQADASDPREQTRTWLKQKYAQRLQAVEQIEQDYIAGLDK